MSAFTFFYRYLSLVFLAMCLCGCTDAPKYAPNYAETILRVRREAVSGTDRDFMIYKYTQGALLKSTLVISRALRSNDLPRNLNPKQITSDLDVDVQENTELIVVRLSTGGRKAAETEQILNKVVEAYQQEVVNKERLGKVEQLTKLRQRYQEIYDGIVRQTEEAKALAQRLGLTDIQQLGSQAKVQFEIGKSHLLYLQKRLVELQLERLDEPEAENESSKVDAKIKFASELVADQKERLRSFGGTSGELQARIDALNGLRAQLTRIEEAKSNLEIELDGEDRVLVIQQAHAK